MFLAELQPEEKTAFLELASWIAKSDGNKSVFENSLLDEYKQEMGIKHYTIQGLEIEEIVKVFKSERSKNIVLTEILKLIFSDGVYHDHERQTIRAIKSYFGFADEEYASFKDWIVKIKELEKELGY